MFCWLKELPCLYADVVMSLLLICQHLRLPTGSAQGSLSQTCCLFSLAAVSVASFFKGPAIMFLSSLYLHFDKRCVFNMVHQTQRASVFSIGKMTKQWAMRTIERVLMNSEQEVTDLKCLATLLKSGPVGFWSVITATDLVQNSKWCRCQETMICSIFNFVGAFWLEW